MSNAVSNRDFAIGLSKGMIALTASACILLLASMLYYTLPLPATGNTYSKSLQDKPFDTVMGEASAGGKTPEISGFKEIEGESHAQITLKTTFRADNYPLLTYRFDGWHPGMHIYVIWRNSSNPREFSTAMLNRTLDRAGTLHLTREANWSGNITEIGLHVTGGLRDEPLQVQQLTLKPSGWGGIAAAIWSEWTAFQGWSGRSINLVSGTPGAPGTATLSPAPAAASWGALALLLLFGFGLLKRRKQGIIACSTTLLVPWILLDLCWQWELSTQQAETRHQFAGKTTEEKHLADIDRDFYLYARYLKEQVLPAGHNTRIFLIQNSKGQNAGRLKIQYYLLPNNVYNFGSAPHYSAIRDGDYILARGELPNLEYVTRESKINWRDANNTPKSVPVRLLDESPMGNLYIIERPKIDNDKDSGAAGG